jgi:RNA polymerase sigma-70 factor (ECF subfamily)
MNREPTDAQLLARLEHDREALRAFYLRHVGAVTRFLARRCRTPEDLADAVAQTFVELIGSASRYDAARGNATAWLFGIAAHTASAQWRDQQRAAGIAAAVSGRRLLDEDDYARLEARIDASRLRQPLSDALGSLAPAEREIVELVDIDGLAPTDAARILGINPAAARMRLARGRRRMRAALAVEAPDAVQMQGGGR